LSWVRNAAIDEKLAGPGPCNKREEDEETSPKSHEFLDQNSDADGSPISNFFGLTKGWTTTCSTEIWLNNLGGGFKYFLFSPVFGEDSQFE